MRTRLRGGSAAKPLNFIGKVLLRRRSRFLGGGGQCDNLGRIGEEGGEGAEGGSEASRLPLGGGDGRW